MSLFSAAWSIASWAAKAPEAIHAAEAAVAALQADHGPIVALDAAAAKIEPGALASGLEEAVTELRTWTVWSVERLETIGTAALWVHEHVPAARAGILRITKIVENTTEVVAELSLDLAFNAGHLKWIARAWLKASGS